MTGFRGLSALQPALLLNAVVRRRSTGPSYLAEDRSMKRLLVSALLLASGTAFCNAAEFEPPVRLMVGGVPIRVDAPGYAAPCLGDVDGDGQLDLLLGQYSDGKIRVFKGLG